MTNSAPRPAAPAFEPRIVGLLCHWCSYAGADKAGAAQVPYAPNVRVIRVMCTGRIDPQLVLKAYEQGADAVVILGCHPGDCHYKEQNYRTIQRHRILLRLLRQFGIEDERCRLDFVSAAEGEAFARIMTEMADTVRRLGPLVLSPASHLSSRSNHHGDSRTRREGAQVPDAQSEDDGEADQEGGQRR